MTAQAPALDPTSTTLTADQVFSHPLPQIRQFHRQLTTQLDEKNARLRTLVGGSYRELLGTAELILRMRSEIGDVEDRLGRVGVRCGRDGVGKGGRGLRRLIEGEGGSVNNAERRRREELLWSARVKGLSSCALVMGRLLLKRNASLGEDGMRAGDNLVLAAKVLVLSRLLVKSVGELAASRSMEEDHEVVEELKRKLGSLRERLLRGVKRTLQRVVKSGENREDIIQALTAYALATSSGSRDVLRHFLHVRGDAIGLAFEDDETQPKQTPGVLKALELYTATLLDVQALVPRRLSESLLALKSKALLKDDVVRQLEALRLDVCEKWFGDDVLYFTPYIRHDDLDGPQAVDTLKGWSKRASEVLLQGLAQAFERTTDFKTVVEIRTKILEIWIKEGGKARGFDPSIMLEGIRKVVNDRLAELLETRISKLHLVGTEIQGTLGSWQPGVTDKHESLWEASMLDLDISNGAALFKESILSRTHGRNDAVHRVFSSYQTWRTLVDEVITVIEQLKKQRWDDDLEDIEDDLTLESRNSQLSQEDPEKLQHHLDTSLERNYRELNDRIGALLTTYKDDEHIGPKSIYILRVIRDVRAGLLQNPSVSSFGLGLVPDLHQQLAISVSSSTVETFIKARSKRRVPARALWEGDPPLPVQPTPATFKFLRSLCQEMANSGSDLWSPSAVKVLKRHLKANLAQRWPAQAAAAQEEKTASGDDANGEGKTGDTGKVTEVEHDGTLRKEILTQALFDLLVLENALLDASAEKGDDDWEALVRKIEGQIDIDAGSRKRLQVGAREYWKRTSLLFGLLA